MTRIVVYNNPLTTGTGAGLHLEPNSPTDLLSPFEGVDFEKGQIFDNGSLYRSTVNKNGQVYTASVSYSYNKINTITAGINSQTVISISDINLSLNDWLLYEGDVLTTLILSGNDQIYGADGDDVLWGYEGNDFLSGGGGNDKFYGGGGYDTISGGSGIDTAIFGNDKGDYAPSKNPLTGEVDILFKNGATSVEIVKSDVEYLQFRDETITTSNLNYWGKNTPVISSANSSVFRFFNTRDNAFFYTNNVPEKDAVLANSDVSKNNIGEWPYVFQGSTFEAAHSYLGSVGVHRFYNTQTGHHFFTVNQDEVSYIKNMAASGAWPFLYEGVRFNVYSTDPTPSTQGQEIPVYRFYSNSLNRHFFTSDITEVNLIKATGMWTSEGIAFYGEIPG
jgi:hypothetical protein